jgi:hypothetical protein
MHDFLFWSENRSSLSSEQDKNPSRRHGRGQ